MTTVKGVGDKGCAKDENLSLDQIWLIGWIDGSIGRTLHCRMASYEDKQTRMHTYPPASFSLFHYSLQLPHFSLPSVFGVVSLLLIVLSPEKIMNEEGDKGWIG